MGILAVYNPSGGNVPPDEIESAKRDGSRTLSKNTSTVCNIFWTCVLWI